MAYFAKIHNSSIYRSKRHIVDNGGRLPIFWHLVIRKNKNKKQILEDLNMKSFQALDDMLEIFPQELIIQTLHQNLIMYPHL